METGDRVARALSVDAGTIKILAVAGIVIAALFSFSGCGGLLSGGGDPPQPEACRATPIGSDGARIRWLYDSRPVGGFEVQRATTIDFGSEEGDFESAGTADGSEREYIDAHLPPNTLVHYRVRARGRTDSQWSDPASVKTGVVKWTARIVETERWHPPAVGRNGALYVVSVGRDNGALHIVGDGGEVETVFETSYVFTSGPVVAPDGTAYIATDGGRLYAISADGRERWHYGGVVSSYSSNCAGPAVGSNGFVYFSSNEDGVLYCFDTEGAVQWSYAATGLGPSPAIAPDGSIYALTRNTLHALDSNGTLQWTYGPTTDSVDLYSSAAIGSDGTVYFADTGGTLHAVAPDGTGRWTFLAGGAVRSAPIIGMDDTVYFGADDGVLYAVRSDGTEVWRVETTGRIRSAPAIDSLGRIYFNTDGDRFRAIDSVDGTEVWSISSDVSGWEYGSSTPVAIGPDGTVYVILHPAYLYALATTSSGPGNTPWPMYQGTAGRVGRRVDSW